MLSKAQSMNRNLAEYQTSNLASLVVSLSIRSLNRREDRKHHFLTLCPVSGCTASFESEADLESHIAANLQDVQQNKRRTANDIARLHLTELIRTTSIDTREHTKSIISSQNIPHADLTKSEHCEKFSSLGWALRIRKHTNPMSDKIKNYIEKMWLESQESRSKFNVQQIQQRIRSERDAHGEKLFQTHEYPTLNQIKYRTRKISMKYGVTAQQELITDLIELHTE